VNWRDSEQHLSIEYLDNDTAELMDIVSAELPFERVRDGNITAWVLRAEHAGVITTAERVQLLASIRAARQKREAARGLAV
jgi:hypothetical protein